MNIKIERDLAGYGWIAVDDDAYNGPGSLIGHGKTETEAYQEFLLAWWDRGPRYRTAELISLMREAFGDEDWIEEEALDPDHLREDRDERLECLRGLEDE